MERTIIIVAFFLLYFNINGLATTNIVRFTSGNALPVLASKCVCGNCGAPIKPFYQLQIISFISCRRKCKSCKVSIPLDALILEIVVLFGMFLVSAFLKLLLIGVSLSFLFYEAIRVIMIAIKGKRSRNFAKQYFIAVLAMIPYFLITLFFTLIYMKVCV